ncbi:MAG TPA: hypothetical protein VH682_09525 [Gemmataceae bacterium]
MTELIPCSPSTHSFTDDELDFIVNYNIKYRLDQDGEGEADE